MEARMDEDAILSMMSALLEAQEKGLANAHGMEPIDGNYAQGNQSGYGEGYNAWEPTGHHNGFDGSSGYQGEHYAPEDHHGYGEGYNAWEPTGEHGFDRSYTYQEAANAQEHNSGYEAGYQSWESPSTQAFDSSSAYQGDLYDQAYRSEYGAGYDTWEPTCTPEPSSDFQGGHYAQEHQSGYEEGYNSWDMHTAHGEPTSSPLSYSEDTYNMMKMLLEAQQRSHELINSFAFGPPTPTPFAAATEHVGSFTNNLTTWNEEDDSDCLSFHETAPTEIPPIDMGYGFEDIAPLTDDFLHEAELTVAEFEEIIPNKDEFQEAAEWAVVELEFLLGYGGDANLELSYEDQYQDRVVCEPACPGGSVDECITVACERSLVLHPLPPMEVIHMPPVYKMENKEGRTEVASPPGQDTGIPLRHPSPKATIHDLGSLPTTEAPHGHPWTLPYEEIRMQEFGGWFYDEYDPGDQRFRRVHLDKSQA